jgi:hypothetical protein
MKFEVPEDMNKCMEEKWSDGLPIAPSYSSLVDEMLDAIGWEKVA